MDRSNLIITPGSLQARLAALVKQWEQEGTHSAAASQLLALIINSKPAPADITDEDSIMLSLIFSDLLKGANIAQKYPIFFLRLLENQTLLEDFLDAVDSLRQTEKGVVPDLPGELSHDLSFLRPRPHPNLVLKPAFAQGWRLTLQQTVADLQAFFFPPPVQPALAVRRGLSLPLDEDDWFTLFRQEVMVADVPWTIMLEGKSMMGAEISLSVDVSVVPMLEQTEMPSLLATLQWGHYHDQVLVGPYGRATFPPIPLDLVVDEEAEVVKSDIQLVVEMLQPITPSA
ncbi:MAG: hypothetical protein KJ063_07960 [Anaerolineae bacterium]|nr:hypothetical protein [Anaerolineae bacterium]